MVEVSPAMLHWVTSPSISRRTSAGLAVDFGAVVLAGAAVLSGSGSRIIETGGAAFSGGLGFWYEISCGFGAEEDPPAKMSTSTTTTSRPRLPPAIRRVLRGRRGSRGFSSATGATTRTVGGFAAGAGLGVGWERRIGSPHEGQWTMPRAAAGTKNSQPHGQVMDRLLAIFGRAAGVGRSSSASMGASYDLPVAERIALLSWATVWYRRAGSFSRQR